MILCIYLSLVSPHAFQVCLNRELRISACAQKHYSIIYAFCGTDGLQFAHSDLNPQFDWEYATGPGCLHTVDIIAVSSQSAQYRTRCHNILRHPHYVTRLMFGSVLFPVFSLEFSFINLCCMCMHAYRRHCWIKPFLVCVNEALCTCSLHYNNYTYAYIYIFVCNRQVYCILEDCWTKD